MELNNRERYSIPQRTYDCEPTLTDGQVLQFCTHGFLVLNGVVPDEINRRTIEYLEANTYYEPTEILRDDWFVENVILNPQAAGAVRSLLGMNFGLPILMSQHRGQCPSPPQGWHRDGGSKCGPDLNYLQVFYYPQDTPLPRYCPVRMLTTGQLGTCNTTASFEMGSKPLHPRGQFSSQSIRYGTVAQPQRHRRCAIC